MSGMGWCPACREWTVIDAGRPCAWCGTRVVEKRGGWKRPDLTGRISEPAARAIHAKYQTGISANRLGKELYQVLGYKTPGACALAIGDAFRRHGLPVRGQVAATVLASTRNGLSPRDPRERYARRKAAGLVPSGKRAMQPRQPRCKAVKSQAPQKGRQCLRPAMLGSDYCQSHDPAGDVARREQLARMRARRAAA